jgi:lysophospholipase L1-like esterase
MDEILLPIAPNSTVLTPLPTNQTPILPTNTGIAPVILPQPTGVVQTTAGSVIPLNTSTQNALSSTPDLLAPRLDVFLVADDGFSRSDQVTSQADITGQISDDIGVNRFLGRFADQANFVDISSSIQADGTFTLDRQRLDQIRGGFLTDGAYQFEVQAVDLAGNANTKSVQFTLENPLQYSFKINDNEIATSPVVGSNEINKFRYTGNWNLANESNSYNGDAHWTNETNASYEVNFYGSQAQLFNVRNPWGGIAAISVDGGAEQLVDTYGTDWQNQSLFTSAVLETGQHTIRVRVTGQQNAASGDHMISIDRLEVTTPTLASPTTNIGLRVAATDLDILDGSSGLTATASVNNQALLFSPYGWGTINNSVQTSNAGAYLKFRFNGSEAILNVDTSDQTSFPLLDIYVDGRQTGDQIWLRDVTNGQVRLFNGGAGDHDVVVYFRRRELFDEGDPAVAAIKRQDWLTDAEHLRVTGVTTSGGSGFLANSFARSKTAVFFGDSITEGGTQFFDTSAPDRPVTFTDPNASNTFSYRTYAARLGDLLDVEYGQVGWSGSGWVRPSTTTGNPPVLDSWLRYNGQSTAERNFNPQPDYIFMNLGTNDFQFNPSESNINFNVSDTAYNWLREARQRIPGAEIFVIYPFNQSKNAELRAGIVRYLNENPGDTKVHALNLGAEGSRGLVGQFVPELSIDGVHPTANRHQELAGLLYDRIKPIIGVSSTVIEDTSTASATGLNTVRYTGTWNNVTLPGSTSDSYLSSETGATYEVTFRGDRFRLFGNTNSENGIAAISIDGGPEVTADLYSNDPLNDALLYQSGSLGNDFHTIRVRVTGQSNPSSFGTTIDVGRLEIF